MSFIYWGFGITIVTYFASTTSLTLGVILFLSISSTVITPLSQCYKDIKTMYSECKTLLSLRISILIFLGYAILMNIGLFVLSLTKMEIMRTLISAHIFVHAVRCFIVVTRRNMNASMYRIPQTLASQILCVYVLGYIWAKYDPLVSDIHAIKPGQNAYMLMGSYYITLFLVNIDHAAHSLLYYILNGGLYNIFTIVDYKMLALNIYLCESYNIPYVCGALITMSMQVCGLIVYNTIEGYDVSDEIENIRYSTYMVAFSRLSNDKEFMKRIPYSNISEMIKNILLEMKRREDFMIEHDSSARPDDRISMLLSQFVKLIDSIRSDSRCNFETKQKILSLLKYDHINSTIDDKDIMLLKNDDNNNNNNNNEKIEQPTNTTITAAAIDTNNDIHKVEDDPELSKTKKKKRTKIN